MSQDSEPSIREYARFYGLAKDHLENHPLSAISAPEDDWQELDDTPELFSIDANNGTIPADRLFIDAETASLLVQFAPPSSKEPPRFDEDVDVDIYRIPKLKQELPLLHSDHESDMREFACQIIPNLESEFLPLENIDEEADEGLSWPSKYHDLPRGICNKLETERLEIPSEVLLYLQSTLKWHLEGGEHTSFEDANAEPSYKRSTVLDPALPLLPRSPEMLPYVPELEAGHVDMLSNATSLMEEETEEAENVIFKQDAILPTGKIAADSRRGNIDPSYLRHLTEKYCSSRCSDEMLLDPDQLGDIYSPLKDIKDPPSSAPPASRAEQDHKVEVPLSPANGELTPPWEKKHVSFSEAITELTPELPTLIPASDGNPEEDIDTCFERSITPIAANPERSIEQEQLQDATINHRVGVPTMDFFRPKAPWDTNALQTGTNNGFDRYPDILDGLKTLHREEYSWPLGGKVERELRWMAFPAALAEAVVEESITDDGSTAEFIKQPECLDPDTLVRKPEGLRILDDLVDSNKEELEEANFPDGKDFQSLLKKRKLEIADDIQDLSLPPQKLSQPSAFPATHYKPARGTEHVINTMNIAAGNGHGWNKPQNPFGSVFSALDALDIFMAVRKGTFEDSKDSLPADASTSEFKEQQSEQRHHSAPENHLQKAIADCPRPIFHAPAKPIPPVTLPQDSRYFFLSTAFLSNRRLVRQVLDLYPSAEIIERASMQNPACTPVAGPVARALPRPADCLSHEADIIVSPGTGLLWTTLQKAKQRSLPGQISHSALHDRILTTAPRYERLIILVSQGLPQQDAGPMELDESDCEALANLMNSCWSIPEDVEITLVPGGQEELARWIVAMMVKHSIPPWKVAIAHEETQRETFLRRAGLNAFAAQAILSQTGAVDDHATGTDDGIFLFVQMSLQDKIREFETLFGGRKLLTRVHQVLDDRW
ncbi:MAG: hypothetical protein Q9217_002405 [Psora testacea]